MKYQTIKVWKTTLEKIRMIYAFTGETMVSIIDRLVTIELNRIERSRTEDEK